MDILNIALQNRKAAWKLIEETSLIEAWESIGATVHIVGSVKTGLIMKNRDIDLHIYTEKVSVPESFEVMRKLAESLPLKEIQYKNLIDTEEECIEWHATCQDKEKNNWKLDMIHIRKGSKYDGVVEKVTDAILHKLTPAIRETILRIKNDIPEGHFVPGIEIYHAVFTGGARNYEEMEYLRRTSPLLNSLEWMP